MHAENYFQTITSQFLCGYPLKDINFDEILSGISGEAQNDLVNSTVEHALNKKYPVNPDYQRLFLKNVLRVLENQDIEICDKIYENISVAPKEITYKHYTYKNCSITLKETKSFVSQGTTGLCTWQASIALTNWFLQTENQKLVEGKTILELGAGTGLCGFSLAKFCNPRKVILTDGSPSVLQNLEFNAEINFENYEKIQKLLLPWENIQNVQLEPVDLIIAADVVYDISVFEDLTKTIKAIFERNGKKCQLIMASTIRNELTYGEFKKYLQINGFSLEGCSTKWHEKYLFWITNTPIEVLKVTTS